MANPTIIQTLNVKTELSDKAQIKKPSISVVSPCYNEEGNVDELYRQVKAQMDALDCLDYEHIFIDNSSEDKTVDCLKEIARVDKRVKIIVNVRNFGHIRSPYYGLLQAKGDAVIFMSSDLQDPPELIPLFIQKWSDGYKVVVGVKQNSQESKLVFYFRQIYYQWLGKLADIKLIGNFTGFGLYDRQVVDLLRQLDESYPYFRGLIAELGFESAKVPFVQPTRKAGRSKNNLYTLYDTAMLGLTSHSKVPLRLAVMFGFASALVSFIVGFFYLVYKLLYWQEFSLGLAPVIVGIFFFSSVQMIFLGIVGEYVGSIYTKVTKRPLVVEKERINFD